METLRLARNLMGSRFELALSGETERFRLRAAAEAAMDEIEAVERRISLYRPESETVRVNALAADAPVQVSPVFFRLLDRSLRLARATDGAFDPTITPWLRVWGFVGARGRMADPREIEAARNRVGWRHVQVDPDEFTVRFDTPGVELDFGAIGKGFGVERGLSVLQDAGVQSALLHGGSSTVGTLGRPPGQAAWRIAIAHPADPARSAAVFPLLNGQALSVSAQHEKSFIGPDGAVYGHVLDPRRGAPVRGAALAAVVTSSATDSDALSTALLVEGRLPAAGSAFPWIGASTLVIGADDVIHARGAGWLPGGSRDGA